MKNTTYETRIATLEGQVLVLSNALAAFLKGQTTVTGTPVHVPCKTCKDKGTVSVGTYTLDCPECKGQDTPKVSTSKGKAKGQTSTEVPSKDADFLTVVVPYLASRVMHNIANGVDCSTDKLTDTWTKKGHVDNRFHLTAKERSLMNASRDNSGIKGEDAVIALDGAVSRKGGK